MTLGRISYAAFMVVILLLTGCADAPPTKPPASQPAPMASMGSTPGSKANPSTQDLGEAIPALPPSAQPPGTTATPGATGPARGPILPPGPPLVSHADAVAASRQLYAEWVNAIKALPALQAEINKGASYSAVLTLATRMADAGYARLDMPDMKARAEFLLQVSSMPGFCENHARKTPLGDVDLVQYLGIETLKRQNVLRIRALQTEAAQRGTPRVVSRTEYARAVTAAIRSMPFEEGARMTQLMQQSNKLTTSEACSFGLVLLRTGMTLPEPISDTFIVYGVTHRVVPDPTPAPPVPGATESPGPRLGI